MPSPRLARRTLLALAASSLLLSACQTTPPYTGPVLPIEQSERGVQIFLPSNVLFDVGKASLSDQGANPYLDRVASLLKTKTQKAVALEGHADNTGNDETNQTLSTERAATIARALEQRGVPASRLTTAGFAARRPVASNATEEGRRLNRRVELIILDEKVETITRGEPANAFSSAWGELKRLVEQGVVKPVEKQ